MPGEDKHCDTDSDVDSATLDETNDDWGSSPRSGYRSANLDDTNGEWGASPRSGKTVDSDGEEVDQFNEGTNAYRWMNILLYQLPRYQNSFKSILGNIGNQLCCTNSRKFFVFIFGTSGS